MKCIQILIALYSSVLVMKLLQSCKIITAKAELSIPLNATHSQG